MGHGTENILINTQFFLWVGLPVNQISRDPILYIYMYLGVLFLYALFYRHLMSLFQVVIPQCSISYTDFGHSGVRSIASSLSHFGVLALRTRLTERFDCSLECAKSKAGLPSSEGEILASGRGCHPLASTPPPLPLPLFRAISLAHHVLSYCTAASFLILSTWHFS